MLQSILKDLEICSLSMRCFTFLILALLVIIPFALSTSHAEFSQDSITITLSTDGMAKVVEKMDTRTTVSSIIAPLISDKISNLIVTDEKNNALTISQNGNQVKIDTLGASRVTLTYSADILKKTTGIWDLNYNSTIPSTVILPPTSVIVSAKEIPNDIQNNVVSMPTGQVSLSYAVRDSTANQFIATWNKSNYVTLIITASKIEKFGFDQSSKSLSFTVDSTAPVLVVIPNSLLGGPYGIQLNNNPMEFKQSYQNSTHSWLRIEPSSSGSIKIIGTTAVPEFPTALLALVITLTSVVFFSRRVNLKI